MRWARYASGVPAGGSGLDVLVCCSDLTTAVLLKKIPVEESQALAERSLWRPSERAHAAHIQELAGRAVGLAAVVDHAAPIPHRFHHERDQLPDGQIFPATDVEQRRILAAGLLECRAGQIHQENRGIRE